MAAARILVLVRDAIFLLAMPVTLGFYGLALLLNLFGATTNETNFYRGRGEWFPILDGDKKSTHRLVGGVLVLISVVSGLAIVFTGVLKGV